MNFIKTSIPDVVIIEPILLKDDRGYFFESFKKKVFEENIGQIEFVQENESKSIYGVLRGLHYQIAPFAQSKLVRVVKGKVLDVAVDIRENSVTYGKYISVILSDENNKQLFIPQGFAHGFVCLSDEVVFSYKCDNYYDGKSDRGIAFDDPHLNIDWQIPTEHMIISNKDRIQPKFES